MEMSVLQHAKQVPVVFDELLKIRIQSVVLRERIDQLRHLYVHFLQHGREVYHSVHVRYGDLHDLHGPAGRKAGRMYYIRRDDKGGALFGMQLKDLLVYGYLPGHTVAQQDLYRVF